MPEDTKIILDKESHKKNQIKYLIGLSPIIIYCVHYFTSPMNSFEDLEAFAFIFCLIILIHTGALYYTYLNWDYEKYLGLGLITSAILNIIIIILIEVFTTP